jgi:hypothetical protein
MLVKALSSPATLHVDLEDKERARLEVAYTLGGHMELNGVFTLRAAVPSERDGQVSSALFSLLRYRQSVVRDRAEVDRLREECADYRARLHQAELRAAGHADAEAAAAPAPQAAGNAAHKRKTAASVVFNPRAKARQKRTLPTFESDD